MQKTAIIYQRVSTDEQAARGYSIQAQGEKLERYCRENDIRILAQFEEDYSAKDGFDRPEYKKLVEFVKRPGQKPDFVLVTQWSRFSRNVQYSLNEIDRFEKLGVQINATDQWIDGSIPENLFLLVIYLTTPEIENRRHSLRTIDGMRKAMKMGYWVNHPPYGYDQVRNEEGRPVLVQNANAKLVKKSFELLATGAYHKDEVRHILQKEGMKVSKQTFYNILEKEVHSGLIRVPAYKTEPEELAQGKIEAIITQELFNTVQDVIRSKRRTIKPLVKSHPHLPLRGLLVCSQCSKKLSGYTTSGNGGQYHYYDCKHCNKNRFKPIEVHAAMVKMLKEICITPEVGEAFLEIMKSELKDKTLGNKEIMQQWNEKLKELREKSCTLEEGHHIQKTIPKTTYDMLKLKYEESEKETKTKLLEYTQDNSYILPKAKNALRYLEHLDEAWMNGTVRFQSNLGAALFPENLSFENGQLRTTKVNSFVLAMARQQWGTEQYEKKLETIFGLQSTSAPRAGLEPATP